MQRLQIVFECFHSYYQHTPKYLQHNKGGSIKKNNILSIRF